MSTNERRSCSKSHFRPYASHSARSPQTFQQKHFFSRGRTVVTGKTISRELARGVMQSRNPRPVPAVFLITGTRSRPISSVFWRRERSHPVPRDDSGLFPCRFHSIIPGFPTGIPLNLDRSSRTSFNMWYNHNLPS